jgi:hypothetical protein
MRSWQRRLRLLLQTSEPPKPNGGDVGHDYTTANLDCNYVLP